MTDNNYNKIYTIGCFDWFHHGHERLFKRMKNMGKQIIVGIHDDKSIEQLKNLPSNLHQSIETRMENVKKFADIVYVIPNRDPTFFLKCVICDDDNKENACFVRGEDMPNFPGREFIEKRIDIKFLSYTEGISSSYIRQNLKNLKK
jgi:cytidyltransferase-like protein